MNLNSSASFAAANEPTSTMQQDTPLTPQSLVQHIFGCTSCYDLMQTSSKGTVFETTIPFQLAFFALIEHDTDVAPLWDPELRTFVGLMTVQDYIFSLRLCNARGLSAPELTAQTVSDILHSAPGIFHHDGFQAMDAEDSVLALCSLFLRNSSSCDYVPIVDPVTGNLISLLGPLDILHLLSQIARTNEAFFSHSIQSIPLGTFNNILTVHKSSSVSDVLDTLEARNISAAPVVDENLKLVGLYHRADVSFIMKASDPDAVVASLRTFSVEDSLITREQLLQSGEIMSASQGLVTCRPQDTIGTVLHALVAGRSNRAVIVGDLQQCRGIVSFKDIVRFYLELDTSKEIR